MEKIPYTYTNQEAFDIVYKGIIAQGGPSFNGTFCVFRDPNNRKCAAGYLIPDKSYRPVFESEGLSFIFKFPTLEDNGFVRELQEAHDTSFTFAREQTLSVLEQDTIFLSKYKSAMKTMAEKYNLTVPEQ